MTNRHRHRRAAYLAMECLTMTKPAFTSLAEMKAATQLVEMRRQAQEFSWRKPATESVPDTDSCAGFNGNGHSGALS